MAGKTQLTRGWSEGLGRRLLAAVPNEALAAQWGPHRAEAGATGGAAAPHLRRELLAWARQDEEVRRWITQAWRQTHPAVATAADHALTEGSAANCVALLERFDAEEVLLALLTDEFDDGWGLAATFVNRVPGAGPRRALQAALQRLADETGGTPCKLARVVVLGGHPRDESRLGRPLFERSPFEVRWRVFERKQGGAAVQKMVVDALRQADAAILVTGMASHTLMYLVKDYAQRYSLPWKCVAKATDQQLTAALRDLFPEFDRDQS
jgi:hypothetical protein